MEMWDKIKDQIKNELLDDEFYKTFYKTENIATLVDILKKVLEIQIEKEYQLNGLSYQYPIALNKILDTESTQIDKVEALNTLKNIEPFLKKILYYINRQQFLTVVNEEVTLIGIINTLGLNPKNVWLAEDHLEGFTKNDFEYYLIKIYVLRNQESHNADTWSQKKLAVAIDDTLVFYLEVINKFKEQLKQNIPEAENDFSKYIDEKISEFEAWRTKFIPTNMEENSSSLYEGTVTEERSFYGQNNDSENDSEDKSENDANEDDSEDDALDNSNLGKSKKERSGTVDQIRKENLPERCMMIWGEAGLGKSTTLQYLTHMDAQAYKEGKSKKIPVYIPLGELIEENISIENSIFSELGISVEKGRNLLENGYLNIFLDGVNEIPKDIRSVREKEIQKLLDSQRRLEASKKSLIIISNRPEGNSSFSNIPIFNLKPMTEDQIFGFIEKNTKDNNIINIIKEGIEKNPNFKKTIETPLNAMKLISIVTAKKAFPETEYDLIGEFLNNLYERERTDKKDTNFDDTDRIHYLLAYLAFYGRTKNESNAGIVKTDVLECFARCAQKYGFAMDISTSYVLNILIKMGVLSCNSTGNVISFSHESYQDYYDAQALDIGLYQQDELSQIEENSKKKTSINDYNKLLDAKIIDFYEKEANNTARFKTIQYNIEKESANDKKSAKLKLLSELNIKLAAKIISTDSKCNEEIEDYILKHSDESLSSILDSDHISSEKSQKQVIDRLWVDYYLQDPKYIKKHIEQLMALDNDKRFSLISFVTGLDDTDYILRIIKIIDDAPYDKALKNYYLFKMSDIFYLKNLKFIRNETDATFVNKLSKTYLQYGKSFAERYKFVLAFNIPQGFFNKEEIFNSIELEDIKSIIEVLNNINNTTQICDFLNIILPVESNNYKIELYSRAINCIYDKGIRINDNALITTLIEGIKSLDLSESSIFRVSHLFDLKKEDIPPEKLYHLKMLLTRSITLRLYNQKQCEDSLKKYFDSYTLPSINELIVDIFINSNLYDENLYLDDRTIKNTKRTIIRVFEHYLSNDEIESIEELLRIILRASIHPGFKKKLYKQIIECIYSSQNRNISKCKPEITIEFFSDLNSLNLPIPYIIKFILLFNIQKKNIAEEKLNEIKDFISSSDNIDFRLSNEEDCNLFFTNYCNCSLPRIDTNNFINDNIRSQNPKNIITLFDYYLSKQEITNVTELLKTMLMSSFDNEIFKKRLYGKFIEWIHSSVNTIIKFSPELTKELFLEIKKMDMSITSYMYFFISFDIQAENILDEEFNEKLNELKEYFSFSQSFDLRLINKEDCNLFFNKYFDSCSFPSTNKLLQDILARSNSDSGTIKKILHAFENYLSNDEIENITELFEIILSTSFDNSVKKELYKKIIECIYSNRDGNISRCRLDVKKKLSEEINKLNLEISDTIKFILSFNIQREDISENKLVEIKQYFSSFNSIQFRLFNKEECNFFFKNYYACPLPDIKIPIENSLKLRDTQTIKQTLKSCLSRRILDNIIEILEKIPSVSIEDDFKSTVYSEILKWLYSSKPIINGLSIFSKINLLKRIQLIVNEEPIVLISMRVDSVQHRQVRNYYNYSNCFNTMNKELQLQIAKMILSIDFKLRTYYCIDIKNNSRDSSQVLNILSFIIELFLENKDLIGLLYLCEKQTCYLSLLFFYLPFQIRYKLAKTSGYFYANPSDSNSFDYRRRNIEKPSLKYDELLEERIIQLYDQNINPLPGIKIAKKIDDFFLYEFIKFPFIATNTSFNFNTFFIKLSDKIKIQLLELRESFFPRTNIFLYLTRQYEFKKISQRKKNLIWIPLDNRETIFLECRKNNDKDNPTQEWEATKTSLNFNTFFIKLSDKIKIQLLELRESFFPRTNIFLYLTRQYEFKKISQRKKNLIWIPLNNQKTIFLECRKNNNKDNPTQEWEATKIEEYHRE